MRILIVEDEISAREGLAHLLGKTNDDYIVCGKASDGERGLDLAKALKPDLIFVDIEMPRLNGLEMIEKIIESGQEPYFVILSGYSDFKYAQKGIRLGVAEYLLKPVIYSDLKNIMTEINRKFNLKREKENANVKSMPREEILQEIVLGKGKTAEDAYRIVENSVKDKENIYLFNLYIGESHKEKTEAIVAEIFNFMEHYEIINFFYSVLREYRSVIVFINAAIELSDLTKMLKYNLIFYLRKSGFQETTVSLIKLDELEEIKRIIGRFKSLSKWAIVIGNDEVICQEQLSKLKILECSYPKEIENEALQVIKNNEYSRLRSVNRRLISYLKVNIYSPDNIIQVCSTYIFSILSFLKSCNNDFYTELNNLGIFDRIKSCCTLKELEDIMEEIVYKIDKRSVIDKDVTSLPIRKTLNYIKSYYNNKVSLEEIARGMNITPEYLSRLFTKEIGKSFSDYLKEFRINEAKKLLVNDKLKIYEVAQKVGYSDAKYFCKTFKAITGMSPKEYTEFY